MKQSRQFNRTRMPGHALVSRRRAVTKTAHRFSRARLDSKPRKSRVAAQPKTGPVAAQPAEPERAAQQHRDEAELTGRHAGGAKDEVSMLQLYLREVGQVKLLTPQEELALAKRIRKGDEAAREHMIKANLRLVVKIARDYEN